MRKLSLEEDVENFPKSGKTVRTVDCGIEKVFTIIFL